MKKIRYRRFDTVMRIAVACGQGLRKVPGYRPLTYLAVPYSNYSACVRYRRFDTVTRVAVALMKSDRTLNIFSPITHSHPMHVRGLDGDWKFWKRIDTQYLRLSQRVIVLMLPGWLDSVGVQAEIKIAKRMKIPIRYLDPKTLKL
jgi:hypothetical protein